MQDPIMARVRLIQRLMLPGTGMGTRLAFRGGHKNGGLSDETVEDLKEMWDFDYMGAAEFEYGKVPKALQRIVNDSSAGRAYRDRVSLRFKDVLYICEKGLENDVEKVIRQLAEDERQLRLKEPCRLKEALDDVFYKMYGGWLELDNGFMFFVNEPMYQKTLAFFEIKSTTERIIG